jgi:mRNA interferase HigB
MRVLSRRAFLDARAEYPIKADAIMCVFRTLDKSTASKPEELRTALSTLDNFTYRSGWWVIDIGGNELRLIVAIDFQKQYVNVKHIFNHAEYDKANKWYRSNKTGVMP